MSFVDWLDYHEIDRIVETMKQFYFGDEEIKFETIRNFINVSV